MFAFLNDVAPNETISSVHYAIRLLRHRELISDTESGLTVEGAESEPSEKERSIALRILREIEEREDTDLRSVKRDKAEYYADNLADRVTSTVTRGLDESDLDRARLSLRSFREIENTAGAASMSLAAIAGLTDRDALETSLAMVRDNAQYVLRTMQDMREAATAGMFATFAAQHQQAAQQLLVAVARVAEETLHLEKDFGVSSRGSFRVRALGELEALRGQTSLMNDLVDRLWAQLQVNDRALAEVRNAAYRHVEIMADLMRYPGPWEEVAVRLRDDLHRNEAVLAEIRASYARTDEMIARLRDSLTGYDARLARFREELTRSRREWWKFWR